jgi:hypothetical protein
MIGEIWSAMKIYLFLKRSDGIIVSYYEAIKMDIRFIP